MKTELRALLQAYFGEMNCKERYALSIVEYMIDDAIRRRDWLALDAGLPTAEDVRGILSDGESVSQEEKR